MTVKQKTSSGERFSAALNLIRINTLKPHMVCPGYANSYDGARKCMPAPYAQNEGKEARHEIG